MASPMTYAAASEGGHWYDEHGNQIAEVPSADGKRMVKPDIRHARKHQLAPGVTTIIRCAARPDLELWKQRQAIQSALTLPRGANEMEADWLRRIESDMKQHAKQAAEEGTRIHAALQAWLERGEVVEEHAERVANMLAALGDRPWASERGCVSLRGYATKADLCAPGWVVDLKTKDDRELDDLRAYDSHWMQLWATREALGEDYAKARCAILYASRIGTAARLVEVGEDKLEQGGRMFLALLRFWQVKNNYVPMWAEEAE